MCGISGILSTNQLEESDKSVGRKIIDELDHRGPDHKGEFQSKNKKVLLRHFGGLESLRKASIDQIKSIQGIGSMRAKLIYDHFNKQ
jgi:ERCC4-type nuclease